jgi:hypothetical protein
MVGNADPKIKKRAIRTLLKGVRIYPKDKKTQGRLIEIIRSLPSPYTGK